MVDCCESTYEKLFNEGADNAVQVAEQQRVDLSDTGSNTTESLAFVLSGAVHPEEQDSGLERDLLAPGPAQAQVPLAGGEPSGDDATW